MEYNPQKIGERIKTERNKLNKTQTAFAADLGYSLNSTKSRQTIANWEHGKSMPNLDEFFIMCYQLFNCEIGYLACEYDCKNKDTSNISKITGLSENAIATLKHLNKSTKYSIISALNMIIEHESFEIFLQYLLEYINAFHINSYMAPKLQKDAMDTFEQMLSDILKSKDKLPTLTKPLFKI